MTSWESAPSRTADTSLEDPPVLLDGHAIDRQDRAGVERYRQLRKGS
jgi:hypothetical protein